MSNISKKEVEDVYSKIFNKAYKSNKTPDIGIDVCLMKYSGLNSAAELQDYSSKLMERLHKVPGPVKSLCAALAPFTSVPNAVGLGAVIVGILLDLVTNNKSSEDNTADMLRRVFAEEKASGIRDSMDECVKRLCMYVKESLKTVEEIERLEKQLSEQLTRLRNSMLQDKQMSSRAMKNWTNGAAFHAQMLIHAARLEMVENSETDLQRYEAPISIVLDLYQQDLKNLLEKYKIYKKSTFSLKHSSPAVPGTPILAHSQTTVKDKELGSKFEYIDRIIPAPSVDAYVDYMFNNWKQIKELEEYFSDLKKNLRELILRHDAFNNTNLTPDSGTGAEERP